MVKVLIVLVAVVEVELAELEKMVLLESVAATAGWV